MTGVDTFRKRTARYVRRALFGSSGGEATVSELFEEIDLATGTSRAPFSSVAFESKFLVVITTCGRSRPLRTLLDRLRDSIVGAGYQTDFSFLVIEDASQEDYEHVRRHVFDQFQQPCQWLRSRERMGKRGYFRIYQAAFSYIKQSRAERILFLQDDVDFDGDLVLRANLLFSQIKSQDIDSPLPLLLNLFSSSDDEPDGRWVKFSRRQHPVLPLRQTQWFDLNGYLVERRVLELLRFRVTPISESRWEKDSSLSSGVGRQLTQRLNRRAEIFQCFPPLIFHGREPSVMNSEARRERSLDNYHLRDCLPPVE